MERDTLIEKITAAKNDIGAAETTLDAAIRDIEIGLRWEKTTVSAAVETAFARLRAAQGRLIELEALLSGSEP